MTTRSKSHFARRITCIAALAAMVAATSGCSRLKTHQGYVGESILIDAIQVGVDNKQSVQATLGRPTFDGQFDKNDWYYFARDSRQLAFSKPKATSQNVIHIRFDSSGNVASINQTGMEKIAKISPEGDKTPTLGRNSGFFEDVFGNVGSVGAPGGGAGQ